MESLTKPKVTHAEVGLFARRHLGETPKEVHELTDGWFNAAFAVSMPSGEEFVLKVAPPPHVKLLRYERDLMRAEVEAMRLASGVSPVPEVVAYEPAPDTLQSACFLMRRLPGVAMNRVRETLDADQQAAVDRQVGQIVSRFGSLESDNFGLWNGPGHPTWKEAYLDLLGSLEQDAADAEVALPEGTFACVLPALDTLEEVTKPVFVHWDMWDGNVFVDPESLQVTGVIDFERALWGDPLMEANFMTPQPGFVEGYGSDLRAPNQRRRFLYDLYLMIVMVVESKYRGFTAEHEAWPRGELERLVRLAHDLR